MARERKGVDRLWKNGEDPVTLTPEEIDQLHRARKVLGANVQRLNNERGIKNIKYAHPDGRARVTLYPSTYEPNQAKYTPADIPTGYVPAVVLHETADGTPKHDDVWITYTLSVYGIKKGINPELRQDGRVPTQARFDLMGLVRETLADGEEEKPSYSGMKDRGHESAASTQAIVLEQKALEHIN